MKTALSGHEIVDRVTEARYRTARTKDLVLAMLDAIREPSEAMYAAGKRCISMGHHDPARNYSDQVWRAMIDALREEIAG